MPVVVVIVRPLIDVAVATPRAGVTKLGPVARTKPPEPVTDNPSAAPTPVPKSVSQTTLELTNWFSKLRRIAGVMAPTVLSGKDAAIFACKAARVTAPGGVA